MQYLHNIPPLKSTPSSFLWTEKVNTGQTGDDIGSGKPFKSVKLAKNYAYNLPKCVGFTHNKNTNLFYFHHNLGHVVNEQNHKEVSDRRGTRRWQWCNLYTLKRVV